MSKEGNSRIVLGLLAGAAIGSLLGVLFAPDKGSETRKKIRKKAGDLKDVALDKYETLSERAKYEIESLVSDTKKGYENYKDTVEEFDLK